MMVESSFVFLCKPLDFAGHNIHLQVSVEVIVFKPLIVMSKNIVEESDRPQVAYDMIRRMRIA